MPISTVRLGHTCPVASWSWTSPPHLTQWKCVSHAPSGSCGGRKGILCTLEGKDAAKDHFLSSCVAMTDNHAVAPDSFFLRVWSRAVLMGYVDDLADGYADLVSYQLRTFGFKPELAQNLPVLVCRQLAARVGHWDTSGTGSIGNPQNVAGAAAVTFSRSILPRATSSVMVATRSIHRTISG